MSLEARMREVLGKLECLSHGSTQAWNTAGGEQGHDSVLLWCEDRPHDDPPHIHFRRRFESAVGGRVRIVEEAEQVWRDWTGRSHKARPEGESLVERNARLCREGVGLSLKECALKFRCSEGEARKARLAAGRRLEDGKVDVVVAGNDPEKARDLRDKGFSVRQIALIVGKDAKQIQRWLAA